MDECGLQWYVFGAQAAIIWGSSRLSADVDVTAAIEPETLAHYTDAMSSHGFEPVIDDSEFVARTRVLPFVHRTSGMPLDVVLAGPGLEEEFLRRAIPVDVDGTLVPVISPEDLIVTKILAGRPKDIEDIRSVIHQRASSLDEARIREVLSLLEEALGQSDLLPVFEKEWVERMRDSTAAKKAGHPSKPKRKPKKK